MYLELYAVKLSNCSFNTLFGCKNLEEIKLASYRFILHKLDQEQVSESSGLKLKNYYKNSTKYKISSLLLELSFYLHKLFESTIIIQETTHIIKIINQITI